MADFLKALEEVKPAFGAATESLNSYCLHGIINCGENFDHLLSTLRMLVHQVGPVCASLLDAAPARANLSITCQHSTSADDLYTLAMCVGSAKREDSAAVVCFGGPHRQRQECPGGDSGPRE